MRIVWEDSTHFFLNIGNSNWSTSTNPVLNVQELNDDARKNYGWPLFSYGINYDGAQASTISKDSAATFTILPEYYWTVPTNYGSQTVAPACLLKVNESTISD
ncbi:MAG: hypothetical protein ACI94Y_003113 [Maribacter sp.]|jgi:hypothetical protein